MTDTTMSLAGKRVIVIGGSSGIGFAVATLARQLGAAVAIASSNAASVNAAVERLTGATGYVVDLKDEGSISRFLSRLEPFDHLAITAGDLIRGNLRRRRTSTSLSAAKPSNCASGGHSRSSRMAAIKWLKTVRSP
jgi:NAD(P)-dependent dehydrogenase (short-subunit alcohol dehydrogenase family)